MNCETCQQQICEALEHADVQTHVAGCATCRAFRDAWARLDSRLETHLTRAVLPGDFKATVLQEAPLREQLTPENLASERGELDREYQDAIAVLNRAYLVPQALKTLHLAGVASASLLGGIFLARLVENVPLAAALQLLGCVIALATLLTATRRAWTSPLQNLSARRLFISRPS